ncbi:MAG: flagellar assembly protein FliW [Phycisphaerales bacterium]|nr:flagellar assembly protein FliW [Phycisphaerales bacterium]
MLIDTVRFGVIEVDDDRLITFPEGLLGFREHKRFALIETAQDAVFFWLQSADDPSLAFVVCDPAAFVPDYEVPVREDDLAELKASDVADSQVLVIVNKVDGWLTANLLGPLVVSAGARLGKQFVLSDRRYGTRQRLREIAPPAAAVARTA